MTGVHDLLPAESGLDRSFAACLASALVGLGWPTYLHVTGQGLAAWAGPVGGGLLVTFAMAYAWFALSVARVARVLGRARGPYLAWLIAAPILWLLLPIPILASIILASPLSLKLLLSGQLRSEIHDRTFAD